MIEINPHTQRRRVRICGCPVDAVDLDQAVAVVARWLAPEESEPVPDPDPGALKLIVTLNPEIIELAQYDDALRAIIDAAPLVVADGIGVVAAARLLASPLPGRVTGIDLLERLLDAAAVRGWRPFLLGARPEVIAAAVANVRARRPQLELAGWHHGYFALDDPAPVKQVAESGADLLFSGMGALRDLTWLHANRRRLNVRVAMGVGGSFDVLSGEVRRAPAWLQRLHLEWLYRLTQDPARWRRQLVLPRFALRVLGERLHGGSA